MLSNGLAFNNIDWISGLRTTMSLAARLRLQLRHWAPGADRDPPQATEIN